MLEFLRADRLLPHVPIRQLISRVGLAIAILVTVSLPLGYWRMHTDHLHHNLEFKAKLNANRIALFINSGDQLWQYQGLRIGELIDLGQASVEAIQQNVYGPSGSLVASIGPDAGKLVASAVEPIVVRGVTVGRIELKTSLQAGLWSTMLAGLFSALLGLGAYFVLRLLPLAALDRTLSQLSAASTKLVTANEALAARNAELHGFNESLEKKVVERTAAASAAAAQAHEASRVKSAFLASMSHEIRTPMNGVFGMADLLSRTELTSHQQRLVGTINQSARTLLTIINDILDLSRIEAGKMELDPQDFDLRECVESAIEILAEDAHKKQIEINLLMPLQLPTAVIGDAGRLRQILVNLVGNAVKFTREGEIAVRVSDRGQRDGKAIFQFAVSDTGIGIDAKTRQLLFKPFSQADSSITRRFGGTGLGLSITQHLVHMMDGTLELESELGRGTTVTFEIALPTSERANVRVAVCPTAIRDQAVLVVDDRATNREIVCNYLADCGAQMENASSAEEALVALRARAAQNRPFVLVILDMILPGTNGLELARLIKSDPTLSGTRLIMITSLSWRADSQSARDAGIGEFLNKPVRRNELLDAVRRSFAKSPAQGVLVPLPVPSQVVPQSLKGIRVLVAEDNPVNQEVAREYLNMLGCEAHIAENGLVAVEAFRNGNFDLIMMDCQMPELDGLSACRKIREIERERGLKRTPVLAVTANAYESDRAMCLAAEMDDFMSKPFTVTQLTTALQTWVRATDEQKVAGNATAAASKNASDGGDAGEKAVSLDLTSLEEFERLGAGMAARLIELYLSTAPKSVRQIMMAIVEGDFEKIRVAAHAMKSSSATVGAHELARLAAILEMSARNQTPLPQCLMLASRLEAEMCVVESGLGRTQWARAKQNMSA